MKEIEFINKKSLTVRGFFEEFHLAKGKIYKLEVADAIKVNGMTAKGSTEIVVGDIITLDFGVLEQERPHLWRQKIEIIYEDKDILLINKPEKILLHSDGEDVHTLTNAVNYYLDKKGEESNCYCVHRLDFETRGLVLFAKHPLAQSSLSYQLENNQMTKEYLALIEGKLSPERGIIELNIGKNRHFSNQYLVTTSGKRAVTEYETVESKNKKSLLRVIIKTGRTHQIRVHLSHLKHPIIGDKIYGKEGEKLMLFSKKLTFIHPRTFEEVSFEALVPVDFKI